MYEYANQAVEVTSHRRSFTLAALYGSSAR